MEHVSSVRPTGKFSEKVENLKRWSRFPGWNFQTEFRVPFTFLVVCTSSRSTVGHRHVPGFTTKWNNFLPIGNSTFATTEISGFFFVNGKRPVLYRRTNLVRTPTKTKTVIYPGFLSKNYSSLAQQNSVSFFSLSSFVRQLQKKLLTCYFSVLNASLIFLF